MALWTEGVKGNKRREYGRTHSLPQTCTEHLIRSLDEVNPRRTSFARGLMVPTIEWKQILSLTDCRPVNTGNRLFYLHFLLPTVIFFSAYVESQEATRYVPSWSRFAPASFNFILVFPNVI